MNGSVPWQARKFSYIAILRGICEAKCKDCMDRILEAHFYDHSVAEATNGLVEPFYPDA
jgi:hypothetical protein